jgi:hypothetical protein
MGKEQQWAGNIKRGTTTGKEQQQAGNNHRQTQA